MARLKTPIDAEAAKKLLRRYAMLIPATTLVGGWCALLLFAWIAFPIGVVDHIPLMVKITASVAAGLWFYWLYRTFKRLPALIDEILERGLALNPDQTTRSDHWLGRPGRRD